MIKLASLALAGSLGIAGLTHSAPAAAGAYVSVGVAVPGVAIAAGPAPCYARPYYAPCVYPAYYPGYARVGYGYPGWYGHGWYGHGYYGYRGGYGHGWGGHGGGFHHR